MARYFHIPAIAVLILLVFSPAINAGFVLWDDDIHVYENPLLTPPSVENTIEFWKSPYRDLYIPATYTAWAGISGMWTRYSGEAHPAPFPFHLANIAIHIINAFLVFRILSILIPAIPDSGRTGAEGAAQPPAAPLLGTLLFALHPLAVESVAWVTGFKDVLCGFFSLISIWQYLLHLFENPGRYRRYLAAFASFALALLSKPSAVAILPALFLIEATLTSRSLSRVAKRLSPWLVPAALIAVYTKMQQPDMTVDFIPPLWQRVFIAGDAMAFYLYKLLFPLNLAIDYGRSPEYVTSRWWLYATWIFPASLAVAFSRSRHGKPLLLSLGLFLVLLLPVSGLIPFIFQNYSTVADRYAYLPLIAPAFMAGFCLSLPGGKAARGIFAIVVIMLALASHGQAKTWRSTGTLLENALRANSESYPAHMNIGTLHIKNGSPGKALLHFAEAARIKPLKEDAHSNLGLALAATGKMDEAMTQYLIAVRINPDLAEAHLNLGVAYAMKRKPDLAIPHLEEGVRLMPQNAGAHYNLGKALAMEKRMDEAEPHFEKALKINPGFVEAKRALELARMYLEENGR